VLRRTQRPTSRVKTQPRRVSGHRTDSGPSTFLTDYLVICGRASARPICPACAALESPLHSSKHIIAELLCPVQRSLKRGFQLPHFCPQIRGSEHNALFSTSINPPASNKRRKRNQSISDRKSREGARRHRGILCGSRRRLGQLLSAMRAIRPSGLNGLITFRARRRFDASLVKRSLVIFISLSPRSIRAQPLYHFLLDRNQACTLGPRNRAIPQSRIGRLPYP
jgi:hypothetical protein